MAREFRAFRTAVYFAAGLVIGICTGQLPIVEAVTNRALPKAEVEFNSLLPEPSRLIHRPCYSVEYDTRNKNPAWVYERLTAEGLKGNANRDHCRFKEDPAILSIFRSTLQDYQGSGFDRGHLAPAANHKCSPQEMEDTFYLSNTCPQNQKFNRGYWARFEKHVRDLTKDYNVVHVFTGPLYLPKQKLNGQKWVKYQVIGTNNVAVPTHFYKILLLEKSPDDITYQGYVLPNEPIGFKVSLEHFRTPVDKIEKRAGIIFKKVNRD